MKKDPRLETALLINRYCNRTGSNYWAIVDRLGGPARVVNTDPAVIAEELEKLTVKKQKRRG